MRYDFDKLNKDLKELNYNGVILISIDQEIVFEKGFGYRNPFKMQLNEVDTPMRIASITKLFTAVAVMKLVELKKLSVEDYVRKYIPDFIHEDITIHHLLSNSSGIANFDINTDFTEISKSNNVLQAVINIFKDKPLEFPPGDRFGYSISGYLLLQFIIEKVSGVTYYEFLKREVFNVLNMTNTYFENPDLVLPSRALPLKIVNNEYQETKFFDMRIAGGGGAFISTVRDVYKLNCTLLNHDILSKDSVNKIFGKNVKLSEHDFYGYGLALSMNNHYGKKRMQYYHPGGGDGVRSFNSIYLNEGIQVIMLSNLDDKAIFNDTRRIIDKFLLEESE